MNRVTQAQLAPGSVFKIVMATAMLEEKVPPESFTAFCPGYAKFYGRQFKCHIFGKGGHGVVDLHNAIIHSCDVFFYNVGQRMGIGRISKYAKMLGLGSKTGIDLPSEETGLVPSEEWVQRVYHRKWYPGETISVSIGQGAVTVTPLQLAYMIGGVASGGEFKQPHLLKDAQASPTHRPLAWEFRNASRLAERGARNSDDTVEKDHARNVWRCQRRRHGRSRETEGIEFCGKSGTAQVIGYDARTKFGKGAKKFKDNAWFVGYAPRRNPEIVVSVLVEEGGHGALVCRPRRPRHHQGILREEGKEDSGPVHRRIQEL